VQASDGIYIERAADADLLAHCRAGNYAYLLTARQVGKSSLMNRTAERLLEGGIQPVIVDLQGLGVEGTPEQWYRAMIQVIEDQLDMDAAARGWWDQHLDIPAATRFHRFLGEVLLRTVDGQVVVFFDEVDTTRAMDFRDDFFTAIRYLFNARATEPQLKRLSFVLIGSASPADLIRDPSRTPFNIGYRVELSDFSRQEAVPLAGGLGLHAEAAEALVGETLLWTGGHPYLTLRVFRSLKERPLKTWSREAMAERMEALFFGAMAAEDTNLRNVGDMLTRRAHERFQTDVVLDLYEQILRGRQVQDREQDSHVEWLKLSGAVRVEAETLQVRNRIYERAFDAEWIRKHKKVNWARRLTRALIAAAALLGVVAILMGVSLLLEQKQLAEERAAAASDQAKEEKKLRAEADSLRAEAVKDADTHKRLRDEADSLRIRAENSERIARQQKALAEKAANEAEHLRYDAEKGRQRAENLGRLHLAHLLGTKMLAGWEHLTARESAEIAMVAAELSEVPESVGLLSGLLPRLRKPVAEMPGTAAVLSQDGRRAMVAGTASVSIFDTGAGRRVAEMPCANAAYPVLAGSRLAMAVCGGSTVRVWESESGKPLADLAHAAQVNLVLPSADGRWIATTQPAGQSRDLTVWDWRRQSVAVSERAVAYFRLSGKRLVVSPADRRGIKVLDLEPGWPMRTIDPREGARLIAVSNDGRTVAAAGHIARNGERVVRVFDVETGLETWSAEHSAMFRQLAFNSDGTLLLGLGSTVIRIWDAASGRLVWSHGFARSLEGARFAGNEEILVWDNYGSVILKAARGNAEIGSVSHPRGLAAVQLSRDRRRLLTRSPEGVGVWDLASGTAIAWLDADAGSEAMLDPSAGATAVIAVGGSVRLWDLPDQSQSIRYSDPVVSARISRDGTLVMAGSRGTGQLRLSVRDASSGAEGTPVTVPPGPCYAFSGDGRFAALGYDGLARIHDMTGGGAAPREYKVEGQELCEITLSPAGRYAAAGSGRVHIWDTQTGQAVARLDVGRQVRALAFSNDERLLAVSSDDPAAKRQPSADIFDAATGKPLAALRRDSVINYVAFSADGRHLVTGGDDGAVQYWNWSTQRPLASGRHERPVNYVAAHPAGTHFASAGRDRSVRVWDTTGREVARIPLAGDARSVFFTPDGKRLAVGVGKEVRMIAWSMADLTRELCGRVSGNLALEAWRTNFGTRPYRRTCADLPPGE
jgi:WD40 repeat protein